MFAKILKRKKDLLSVIISVPPNIISTRQG